MRKFFKELKMVFNLLHAVAKGNIYFAVVTRRKGLNEDGLMQYFFGTRREAQMYADWLRMTNKTFEPLEVVKVLSGKRYECANVHQLIN